MHIPEGYLSPQTYVAAYAVMTPIWVISARRVERSLKAQQVPLLAIAAAFNFLAMMFNIPFGATTSHIAGGTLAAIVLGPWAAVLTMTIALTVQALLFGDGGITTLAANCLNMAVIMPMVGYGLYRLIAGRQPDSSPRQRLAAAVGAYFGLNAAALMTAFLLGIQPLIAHGADGVPLYAPFPLRLALPAVMLPHLLLIGFVEAIVTSQACAFLLPAKAAAVRIRLRPLWIALAVLAVLTPIGLWLPAHFHAGAAWGEWSRAQLEKMLGHVPQGMSRSPSWRAPLADYSAGGIHPSAGYIISAIVGAALIAALFFLIGRLLSRRRKQALEIPAVHHPHALGLPNWLIVGESVRCMVPSGRAGGHMERTLTRLSAIWREAIFSERVARQLGWLQIWEPRVKVACFLSLIVAATFLRHAQAIWLLGALALLAALNSRIRPRDLLLPTWWIASAVAVMLALPVTFDFVTPGEKLFTVLRWPVELDVTRQGLQAALLLVSRVTVCALLIAFLALTTRWQSLLRSLRGLGVPSIFVLALAMTYRYLFLLLRLVEQMHYGKRSRTVVTGGAAQERAWAAGRIAALFHRSRRLSEQVYAAMLARGFQGRIRRPAETSPQARDWLFAAGCLLVIALFMIGDRLFR